MKNIFDIARLCLCDDSIEGKLKWTHLAWQQFERGELCFESSDSPKAIDQVRFPPRPILMSPRHMPKRSFNTSEGKTAFFHAIAHIEFIAISLAWDMLYRFRDMPESFYKDWLMVAEEEAQHFSMIREHLVSRGSDYGDLPAHGGLWEHALQTAEDLLARLAVVPRCMEARGLDATPVMVEKFKSIGDATSAAILEKILNDEIGHVELGTKWFRFECERQTLAPDKKYIELIGHYEMGKPKGPFNREMRIMAGFSEAELDWLEK
ncbi:MAG: ferritin-like domain-containing protein [Methylicorpusculum sp.]|uniref:ferritin-like domain-containing protein n=1 Tax=Methylicorpusculum sp. TaxID=2713644 RepID=UPI00271A1749|nr:ferritin-like domain-containing protein [Methylicorpusculum sp.]MDO8938003.1 ferritin-like domain-containing protein [Methylicorpusculum sp.]MDP2201585.1 ferritin-like domain-containing protein [Methylicorpusculum sp.]